MRRIIAKFLVLFLLACRSEMEGVGNHEDSEKLINPATWTEKAINKKRIGAYAEAVENLKKAVELDPSLVSAHFQMGAVYDEWDKRDEAIIAYKRALELDHKHLGSRLGLAEVYGRQVKNELAVEELKKAEQIKPGNREILYKIALEYWYLQNLPLTVKYYRKAIEVDPEYLQAHLNLASVYERMKEWDKALRELAIVRQIAEKRGDGQTVSVAQQKLMFFKGRMNITDEEFQRKSQPPFE